MDDFTALLDATVTGHAEHPDVLSPEQAAHLGYTPRECGYADRHQPHFAHTGHPGVSFYCTGKGVS